MRVRYQLVAEALGGSQAAFRELLRRYRPEIVRFFLISSHYRSPQTFSEELMEEAARGWERLANTWQRLDEHRTELAKRETLEEGDATAGERLKELAVRAWADFQEAMADDFNTALAIGGLFELARATNQYLNQVPLEHAAVADVEVGSVRVDGEDQVDLAPGQAEETAAAIETITPIENPPPDEEASSSGEAMAADVAPPESVRAPADTVMRKRDSRRR